MAPETTIGWHFSSVKDAAYPKRIFCPLLVDS
jgi:hypothetical protein